MACGTFFDAFRLSTEYLGPEIYTRSKFRSVMQNVIPEGKFPEGVGVNPSVFTVEPNEPLAENAGGTAITNSTGDSSGVVTPQCTYDFTDLSIGFTETTYGPKRLQYRGPLFCKDSKYFEHAADEFISKYLDTMSHYVELDYDSFLFYHYARMVPIYVASNHGFDAPGPVSTSLTAPAATSELTQEMLDSLVQLLIYDRSTPDAADGNGFISYGANGPQWTLQIGAEASNQIIRNNAEFRADVRYGDPSLLLARLGASVAVRNFRHLVTPLPWRFTHNGTSYVPVAKYATNGATKGSKTAVSSTYTSASTAPYEAALVLSPHVMVREHVIPKSTVGPVSWPQTPYMGEWTWKTGPEAVQAQAGDACYDPLHKYGRHFGEIIDALKPGPNPRSGAIIFYRRCPDGVTIVGCS